MAQALKLALGSDVVSIDAPVGKAGRGTPIVTTLAIENMHCGGCIRTVEKTLGAQPDVLAVRANLSTKRVTIQTASQPSSAESFIAALRARGFTASALAEQQTRVRSEVDQDYLRRLGVAGFAAMNIMLLSVSVWSGSDSDMPASLHRLFHWLSALIAIPAIAYAGQPFFKSARAALAARRLNMDVPISLGVLLATGMSLFQTYRGSGQVYFDAATMLLFFLLIGRALDERMRARALSAAGNLLGLRSAAASVMRSDGRVDRIATDAIVPGMRVLIAAGERVPIDARITGGRGEIDESLITGESNPRYVTIGDMLYAGTIALSGPLETEATAAADSTLLAEIGRLMQTAEQARGRYVRLADQAVRLYAPAVHLLGLGTFIGWMLAGNGWEPALTAAIAVLIITCPCALALAVPAVQVVAASRLFRQGIVVKAADGLERLADIDTIVFDKTGTLTQGRPELINGGALSDEAMAIATTLAEKSRHPYSTAVVRAARRRKLAGKPLADIEEVPGEGMKGFQDGRELRLGSRTFCHADGHFMPDQTLWFWEDGREAIPLPLHDEMRPDAAAVTAQLANAGYELEILSGDRAAAVSEGAFAAGITHWRAAQRPDEKIARIQELAASGRKVLMVGDGLNDAPALAAGHAAISPASAADISQNAADAVFQGENLAPIVELLKVAKATRRRSIQNFAIAVGYNILFVPLAMAGLVTPLIAAVAMSASSIAVTANALRLARQKLELGS